MQSKHPSIACVSAGFTLLEIMVVIAIISLLIATALPTYTEYTVRTKMSEVMLASVPCKLRINEILQVEQIVPSAGNWGCETSISPSRYISSVDTGEAGVIRIQIQNIADAVNGTSLLLIPRDRQDTEGVSTLIPIADSGRIYRWVCAQDANSPSPLPMKYLPHSCRE